MSKENENFNSLNEETFIEELKNLDEDARIEKVREVVKKHNDLGDTNRHLFARAKKAEGFEQDDDGNWIKTVEKPKAKETVKPDEELLKRLDRLALKTSGINEADEVELFEKWKTDTGRDSDSIVENSIFQKELTELRTSKANLKATSDIKGESGASGARSDPDYWIAKATKGNDGQLLFSDEMPRELYTKVLERLREKDPSTSKELSFYNSK